MKRFDRLLSLAAALVTGGAMLFATSSADAFTLTVDDTGNGVGLDATIVDNGAGDAANLIDGQIVIIGLALTDWTVNLAGGLTKPVLGSAGDPQMDISLQATSSDAGTLIIMASETGFTLAGAITWVSEISDVSTCGGCTVQMEVWVDNGNGLFEITVDGDTFKVGNLFADSTDSVPVTTLDPFSVTVRITVIADEASFHSIDGLTVPEPTTLGLLGIGLFGLGFAARRRQRDAA